MWMLLCKYICLVVVICGLVGVEMVREDLRMALDNA